MLHAKNLLLLVFFIPLMLTACSANQNIKPNSTQANRPDKPPVSAEVDDLFKQLQITTIPTKTERYGFQIQQAISAKMVNLASYHGKSCTIRLSLQRDGQVEKVTVQGGDRAFCQAISLAIMQATIPAAPDEQTWQVFSHALIDFKP